MSDFNRLTNMIEMLEVKKTIYEDHVLRGEDVSSILSRHIEMIQDFLKSAPDSMDLFTKWAMVDQSGKWTKERIFELQVDDRAREELDAKNVECSDCDDGKK